MKQSVVSVSSKQSFRSHSHSSHTVDYDKSQVANKCEWATGTLLQYVKKPEKRLGCSLACRAKKSHILEKPVPSEYVRYVPDAHESLNKFMGVLSWKDPEVFVPNGPINS